MLKNLVNAHDARSLARKLAGGHVGAVVSKVRRSPDERVKEMWGAQVDREPQHWLSIPAVQRRWARAISGFPDVGFPDHVVRKHLAGRTGLRGLSLGCGTGEGESSWADSGIFDRLDAFDLSEESIRAASQKAAERGVSNILHVTVSDIASFPMPPETYDVVLAEHSLHHMAPMEEVIARVKETLRPGGYFCIDEFVGPTRFQWTERQLAAANGLLSILPERYRRMPDGSIRMKIHRPSLLSMIITDPSEAIESAKIVPTLRREFDVIEERGYGGAVIHLALAGISQNFFGDDDESREAMELCFAVEDRLLLEGEVAHDFVAIVAQKA